MGPQPASGRLLWHDIRATGREGRVRGLRHSLASRRVSFMFLEAPVALLGSMVHGDAFDETRGCGGVETSYNSTLDALDPFRELVMTLQFSLSTDFGSKGPM